MSNQQTDAVNISDLWEKFHSQPAEMSVIGALLYDNANVENVADVLSAEDFVTPVLAEIYELIHKGWRSGCVMDPITLANKITDYFDGDHKAARKRLLSLVDGAAFGPEISDYARQIRDMANRRKLADIHHEGLSRIADFNRDTIDLVERAEKAMRELTAHSGDQWRWSIAKADESERVLSPSRDLIRTGISSLDHKLGGLVRGKPNVIAARPSMGKSIVGVDLARRIAQRGVGVAIFSMEMSKEEIWRRMSCAQAFTRNLYSGEYDAPYYSDISQGRVSKENLERARQGYREISDLPIHIDDRSSLTVAEMERWGRRLKRMYERRNQNLDVIIVDHIQLIKPDKDRRGNQVSEMTDISGALREMAKDLNVALVELCQLNRAVELRNNKRPQLSDLRESGAIEQDAQIVIGLHRPWYYLDRMQREGEELDDAQIAKLASQKWLLEMDILKNREGQTGRVDLFCAPGASHVADLAQEDRYEERGAA